MTIFKILSAHKNVLNNFMIEYFDKTKTGTTPAYFIFLQDQIETRFSYYEKLTDFSFYQKLTVFFSNLVS